MSKSSVDFRFVEVIASFEAPPTAYVVRPGSRVLARRAGEGWSVHFNGHEVPLPDGALGEIGSEEVKRAIEERELTAREEEYQLAPAKA